MGFIINLTLVGIFVVFLALILLSLIVYLFSKIFNIKKQAPKNEFNTANEAPILEVSKDEKFDAPEGDLSNEELVAVLTAAVQASLRRSPECKIRVKSFRRIHQTSPAWNLRGRSEYLSEKL